MLDRLFAALRELHAPGGDAVCFGLDSTSAEVHPDGTGARKTNGPQSIGKSRGGWYVKSRMVSASGRPAMIFRLSGGQANDASEGRALPESWADPVAGAPLAMDRVYEGDETRQLVRDLGMTPVVPPKANRKVKWEYDRKTCKLRNEIERLFRRFKGCRRLFTRFDKLDATYRGFLNLAAFVALLLRGSSTPWKIARNPFIFCLQTLLFVVVLTGVCQQTAERKNRNFKSDGVDAPCRRHSEVP